MPHAVLEGELPASYINPKLKGGRTYTSRDSSKDQVAEIHLNSEKVERLKRHCGVKYRINLQPFSEERPPYTPISDQAENTVICRGSLFLYDTHNQGELFIHGGKLKKRSLEWFKPTGDQKRILGRKV